MEPIKWIFRFKYMHLLAYFTDIIWAQISANYFVHKHFQVANIPEILVLVRCIRSNEYVLHKFFRKLLSLRTPTFDFSSVLKK